MRGQIGAVCTPYDTRGVYPAGTVIKLGDRFPVWSLCEKRGAELGNSRGDNEHNHQQPAQRF